MLGQIVSNLNVDQYLNETLLFHLQIVFYLIAVGIDL